MTRRLAFSGLWLSILVCSGCLRPVSLHEVDTKVAYGVVSMQGSVLLALWWRAAHQPEPA
jgi:hypothetical protein